MKAGDKIFFRDGELKRAVIVEVHEDGSDTLTIRVDPEHREADDDGLIDVHVSEVEAQ